MTTTASPADTTGGRVENSDLLRIATAGSGVLPAPNMTTTLCCTVPGRGSHSSLSLSLPL